MTCDLHTHSTFSDGRDTPEEIIDAAVQLNLSAIALTDHNTLDGLPRFYAAARGRIDAIGGAEFSVDYNNKELHLLGLFIPQQAIAPLSTRMAEQQKRKEQSNLQLVDSLNKAGYSLDYQKIKAASPNGNINRSQIADELIRLGHKSTKKELMNTLLSEKEGHYRPAKRASFFEMLDLLRSLKAVPVLAHPLKQLPEEELAALLPAAREHGLIGMECMYSEYDPKETALSLRLAEAFGLKPSGGSDYHGEAKPHIRLGTGIHDLQVPYDWALQLKASL